MGASGGFLPLPEMLDAVSEYKMLWWKWQVLSVLDVLKPN